MRRPSRSPHRPAAFWIALRTFLLRSLLARTDRDRVTGPVLLAASPISSAEPRVSDAHSLPWALARKARWEALVVVVVVVAVVEAAAAAVVVAAAADMVMATGLLL